MQLTIKQFKSDYRIDVCDEFDNVIYRVHYEDEPISIGVIIMVKAYVRGFAEGWNKARQGHCVANDRILNVEAAKNEPRWQ